MEPEKKLISLYGAISINKHLLPKATLRQKRLSLLRKRYPEIYYKGKLPTGLDLIEDIYQDRLLHFLEGYPIMDSRKISRESLVDAYYYDQSIKWWGQLHARLLAQDVWWAKLHTPTKDCLRSCQGCDFEGDESEAPQWPCRIWYEGVSRWER